MTPQLLDSGFTIGPRKRAVSGLVRGVIAAGAVTALIFGTAGTASADTSTDTVTANVVVTGGITLSGLTPSFTLTGAPGAAPSDVVTYNVATNNINGYNVTVESSGDLLPATPGNLDTIPITDMALNAAAMTSTAQTVHTQAVKSADGGDDFTDVYSMDIPYVNADTYTAILTYTATTL